MTFASPQYTHAGMRPSVTPRGDQRVLADRNAATPQGFAPTWSHLPDPNEPAVCSLLKKNGEKCKGHSIPGRDVCLAHAKVAKNSE